MSMARVAAGRGFSLLAAAFFAISAPYLAMAQAAAASGSAQEITPLKTSVSYSGVVMQRPWSAAVSRADGKAAYILTLDPTYWSNGQIQSLSLVLRKASDDRLLQKMTFTAREFSGRGYSKHRVMSAKRLGLQVQADVLQARVRPGAGGSAAIEELDLAISVDNWTDAMEIETVAPGQTTTQLPPAAGVAPAKGKNTDSKNIY